MDGLEREYGERITFERVNILMDENRAIMDEFGFGATPEFYLVDGEGRILDGWADMLDVDEMRAAFDAALKID